MKVEKIKIPFNGKIFNSRYYSEDESPVFYHGGTCCSLGILSCKDYHTVEEIKEAVEHIKTDSLTRHFSPKDRDGGERNILAVTVNPFEKELERKLIQVGFKLISKNLKRRNGYPQNAVLNFYLYSF